MLILTVSAGDIGMPFYNHVKKALGILKIFFLATVSLVPGQCPKEFGNCCIGVDVVKNVLSILQHLFK